MVRVGWLVRVGGTSSLGELAQDTWKCQRLCLRQVYLKNVYKYNYVYM
jgi:hypothetical protein